MLTVSCMLTIMVMLTIIEILAIIAILTRKGLQESENAVVVDKSTRGYFYLYFMSYTMVME